jgi:hypothetical protein
MSASSVTVHAGPGMVTKSLNHCDEISDAETSIRPLSPAVNAAVKFPVGPASRNGSNCRRGLHRTSEGLESRSRGEFPCVKSSSVNVNVAASLCPFATILLPPVVIAELNSSTIAPRPRQSTDTAMGLTLPAFTFSAFNRP